MTDSEAIERFTVIYARYYRQVYGYAVSRAGSQLAEEIASEVFLIAWRRLAQVPTPALTWLLAVARNVAIDQFRATAMRNSVAAELQAWKSEELATSADVADQVTERLTVLSALATLSESDRELLTLVAWHGLPPRQVAQVVGCSTPTLFVRLHRARRHLAHAMEEEAESADGAGGDGTAQGAVVHSPQLRLRSPVATGEHGRYRDIGEERLNETAS